MGAPIAFVYGNCVFAAGSRRRLGGVRGAGLLLRVAQRGRQARPLPRADRRAGGDRGGRADPAGLPALGAGALCPRAARARATLGAGVRAGAHARARALRRRARSAPGRRRGGAARGVPAREPARPRARRRLLRLAGGGTASARVVGGAQAGAVDARQARAEGVGAGAGAGARRPGPRAAGGLPAGAPGARRRAAVAGAQGVLPGAGGAGGRRPARAARARVRAQRRGACWRRWRAT